MLIHFKIAYPIADFQHTKVMNGSAQLPVNVVDLFKTF